MKQMQPNQSTISSASIPSALENASSNYHLLPTWPYHLNFSNFTSVLYSAISVHIFWHFLTTVYPVHQPLPFVGTGRLWWVCMVFTDALDCWVWKDTTLLPHACLYWTFQNGWIDVLLYYIHIPSNPLRTLPADDGVDCGMGLGGSLLSGLAWTAAFPHPLPGAQCGGRCCLPGSIAKERCFSW